MTSAQNIIRRVCVFCGSRSGERPEFSAAAVRLAHEFVQRDIGLVYGGGSVGLMGVIADAMLERCGRVTGVIPDMLATKELLHDNVTDMHRTPDMHARKALMAQFADAFVALPGGYGTFEELFEVITWAQLGIHRKPIGILNIAGYYDPLVDLLDRAISDGFIKPLHRDLIVLDDCPIRLMDRMTTHVLPNVRQWMFPEQV